MIILGIDPGTVVTGYGIIESVGNNNKLVEYGCIKNSAKLKLPQKLLKIYSGIIDLANKINIDAISVEEAFYAKNVKTTMVLGHARGVILLAAEQSNMEIHEYSPREIKKSISGNGAATKEQVQFMVQNILKIPGKIESEDSSDALAAALCFSFRRKFDAL